MGGEPWAVGGLRHWQATVNRTLRNLFLLIDGLALVGLVAFSVLAALNPDVSHYVAGQIVSAGIVLISALLLRRARSRRGL